MEKEPARKREVEELAEIDIKFDINFNSARCSLLLRLLPEEARERIGNRCLSIVESDRICPVTVFKRGEDSVVFQNTKPYDVSLGEDPIGRMDFHYNEEVCFAEYNLFLGERRYAN